MKKSMIIFILFIFLLITACTNSKITSTISKTTTETQTTTIEQTTTIDDVRVSSIVHVLDYYDNTMVSVTGVITGIDTTGNFFIQDNTAGIYVSGGNSFGLKLDETFIDYEVIVSGVKKTNNGIIQIEMS